MNSISTVEISKNPCTIEVMDNCIFVRDLEIPLREAIDYLQLLPQSEKEKACLNAFEVGFFCLQRVQTLTDTEFVKRQFESLLVDISKAVGVIPETLEQRLISQLSTDDGQVFALIQNQINLTKAVLTEQLEGVRILFQQEIDTSKETSTLGGVMKKLQDLLNPQYSGSVQGVFLEALNNVITENGTLVKAVKTVVEEAVKPLASEVDQLAKQIREKEVVESVLEQTIAKGATYEEAVVVELQNWSKLYGAEVSHVGNDKEPGDILIKLSANSIALTEMSIVIEARNRESKRWGRGKISKQLSTAMEKRGANTAIFLSRTRDGLAHEIGEWGQGICEQGLWVATTHELLNVAIQFLIIRQQLASQQIVNSQLDYTVIEAQLQRIQSSLDYVTKINTHLTYVQENAEGIRAKAKAMRVEIRNSISEIYEAVRLNEIVS
ncbi:MAG: hypothetical protein HWQ38_38065 [Nostoc sp. NMS7]|uniref:hypothetical protein n=1 Tax=Nostoc sp. NMS7 TaxID=2815391 RepID=UPI0025D77D74|nr:hypothetical protein [Nostoc sp. NMS7]MBN3951965.1 hypothetical protein [Nostoc sp. NMS7]